MKSVNIVIPVYNEGQTLFKLLQAIRREVQVLTEIEFIFIVVNDGSTDDTFDFLDEYCRCNADTKFISLTRNFGKEAAIMAGLEYSEGEAVIVMDADLQHPPELIPRMIELWNQNMDVVEACKSRRGKETLSRRFLAGSFYRLFELLAERDLKDHSDFKLLDRKVVNAYVSLPERNRFFRGLIPWFGFSSARIYFDVPDRSNGGTRWSSLTLFRLSINALTGFSSAPLYLINILGVVCLLLSLLIGGVAIYDKFTGQAVSGFTTVILLILLIGSFIMFGLGLIGVYLGQIFKEIKKRPIYIVDHSKSSGNNKE